MNKDTYSIRLAKTAFRDAYARGDVNGVLSIFGDGYSDMSAGLASFYGSEARAVLKYRLKKLFSRYRADLAVTIISIRVQGSLAFDWGWHKLVLIPKDGGKPITRRTRYLEIWQKGTDEKWRIAIFIDNEDVPPQMPPRDVLSELGSSRRPTTSQPHKRSRTKRKTRG
jgi:ketosteroid isomerase-like protein